MPGKITPPVTVRQRLTGFWAVVVIGLVLGLVIGFAAIIVSLMLTSHNSVKAASVCPAGTTCVTGKELVQDPGSNTGTQWMVEDKNGAPMAWVNLYGLYSGGDGYAMPGGLVCVTYKTSSDVACLTPQGNLNLRPANASGPTGASQTLTPGDIAFLHKEEHSSKLKKLLK